MHNLDSTKVEQVFTLMREGKSARKALKAAKLASRDFYNALDADPDLAEQYARARTAMCDALADEALDRVIGCKRDPDAIAVMRIELDARKWLLSKLAPKRYGDKLGIVGGDGVSPPTINLTLDERIARATALLDAARARRDGSASGDDSGGAAAAVGTEPGPADGVPPVES